MAKCEGHFRAHQHDDDEVLCVAYSEAQGCLFSGGNRGIIYRWSLDSTACQGEYKGHTDAVTGFALDHHFLYSCSADLTIRMWETQQGYLAHTVELHLYPVLAVAVIPDTGCIVSCSNERVVYWDPVSKEVLGTFTQPQEFCCLHVSVQQKVVAVGSKSGPLTLFPIPEVPGADATPRLEEGATDLDEAANRESLHTLDSILKAVRT